MVRKMPFDAIAPSRITKEGRFQTEEFMLRWKEALSEALSEQIGLSLVVRIRSLERCAIHLDISTAHPR